MVLLDTNVVSELRRSPHENVARWASRQDDTAMLSAITIKELEYGILKLARHDPRQAAPLRDWFENGVLVTFANRILPIDAKVAQAAAALHLPGPAPENDAYIAATALVHHLTVATRNVKDFAQFPGLRVVNPWDDI